MAARPAGNVTYEPQKIIQPIYTGGDVSLDSTGQILAACVGEDAVLTSLGSGATLCRIEGDGETLTTLRITPDGAHLVLCSRSLSMGIYSLDTNGTSDSIQATLLRTLRPHSTPVVTATIDSTSTLLATGSADGVIKVWDIRGGYVTHTFRGHSGLISALHFFDLPPELVASDIRAQRGRSRNPPSDINGMSNGKTDNEQNPASISLRLASGGEDGKIRIWDLVRRKAIASLDSHVSVVRALDFSSEHGTLVSASRDKTIITWDPKAWRIRRTIPVLETLESAGFIEGSQYVFSGGENGVLRIWNIETGRESTREQSAKPESEGILQVVKIPSEHLLVTVHVDNTLRFHSTESLINITSLEAIDGLPVRRQLSGTHDEIIDMAYVGPEKNLMALATNSESVRLISVDINSKEDDALLFGVDVDQLEGHEDIVICLDVDWSGCWLATGAKDNSARLWHCSEEDGSFRCHSIFTGHTESLGAVALPKQMRSEGSLAYESPSKHPPPFLLTGSQDKTIKRWNIHDQEQQTGSRAWYTKKAHEKDINAIAINYNSTLFASASQDRTVKIWSIDEGEVQGVLRGHKRGVWSVQFAPRTTPSISGDSGTASSGRGLILTGSGDKTVKMWSLSDYSCIRTFEGHTNTVLKVIWISSQGSAEGSSDQQSHALAASAASDGLVKIWDGATGECAATLDNHTDRVWSLTLSPKTGHIVSGGADSVITFWADTTEATAAATVAEATARVEQEQDLQNYVHTGNYREAITLALQLDHPARLLALFTTVINTHPPEAGSLTGLNAVDDVVVSLSDEQLYTLLLRIRDWNTNAKTAHVAQRLLWVIMRKYPATRLVELRKQGRGISEVLEAMRVYTERHFKRCEELIEESYLVDFVLRGMEEGGFVADEPGPVQQLPSNGINGDVIMVE